MPAVSVIIPNYNHELYLKHRIDSVLNQTYLDFEVILLDDCSADKSKEIIEQYRNHPKVSHIVYNEVNSGSTFKQWNKGVQLAIGDLIWIAESDDIADPEFLNTLVQVLKSEPKVGVAYVNSYFIDADGRVFRTYIDEYASWSGRWKHDFINNGAEEIVSYLRFSPVILNVSSCIFRKSLFNKVGGCSEEYKLAGDWFTYVKMLQFADIAYCARPLNYFRCHAQTVRSSSKKFVHFFESIKVVCFIYQNFNIPLSEKKAQAYTLLAQFCQLENLLSLEQKSKVLTYLRKNFMWNIDFLLWKYCTSTRIKKIFHS